MSAADLPMVLDGIAAIPEHMHEAVTAWVERAEPHPSRMGGFLYAVLSNNLVAAFSAADYANGASLRAWAAFLYNDMPQSAWGSEVQLMTWFHAHHPLCAVEHCEERAGHVGPHTGEAQ